MDSPHLLDELEDSLPLCQSVCENFFRVCGYEEDLWRCSSTLDEVSPEIQSDVETFFPGAPFKKNEYLPRTKSKPKIVCTPSIKGAAQVGSRLSSVILILVLLLCTYLSLS